VTFAYITGWRVDSEVMALQWHQVDLKAGIVRLEPGMSEKRRGPPVRDDARAPGHARGAEGHDRGPSAQDRQDRPRGCSTGRGKPIKCFRRSWELACEAAGCPGRIPHDSRRTAVRNLERAGVSRSAGMRMVGHKTESIYRRYAITSESDIREAAEKLARLDAGQSPGQSEQNSSALNVVSMRV
jgi:integrase